MFDLFAREMYPLCLKGTHKFQNILQIFFWVWWILAALLFLPQSFGKGRKIDFYTWPLLSSSDVQIFFNLQIKFRFLFSILHQELLSLDIKDSYF